MEKRSRITIKIHAAQRYIIWHYLQPFIQNVRVSEFPKSGGTWLCQMLAALLNKDFPRNRGLPLRSCIQHSHYTGPVNNKTIVMVRDGRDVMTSAYVHFLLHAPGRPRWVIRKWREKLGACDVDNIKETMPLFIKIFSENFKIGGKKINWSDHVMSFQNEKEHCLFVRYEDLLLRPNDELGRILQWLHLEPVDNISRVVERYSFQKQTNRMPGTEDRSHFLRKGIAGDWKNYFTNDATETFNTYHLSALKAMGYD